MKRDRELTRQVPAPLSAADRKRERVRDPQEQQQSQYIVLTVWSSCPLTEDKTYQVREHSPLGEGSLYSWSPVLQGWIRLLN